MNPELASQLRDIHGLDPVSWWPLAAGWWLVIGLALVVIFLLVLLIRNLHHFPIRSWHRDAWRQLRELKRQSDSMPVNQLATDLSELLRRIAIARIGRERAAGLTGEHWLAWLHDNDPAGFDWSLHGKPLLTLPYAPPEALRQSRHELLPLIDAALAWTDRLSRFRHV